MRWKSHVRFGGRAGETHRPKGGRALRLDPYHSPWQRGAVENHNGHVRAWFPRGTCLAGVDPQEADSVARLLNRQRRKVLGWQTAEARWLAAGGVLLESPQTRRASGLVVVGR